MKDIAKVAARASFALLSVVVLARCSSPGTNGSDLTVTSASGALRVAVVTSPQPPVQGLNEAVMTITDAADGTPLDGLTLAVTPWMPSMGHGTSLIPAVMPQGGGQYLVTNLDLYMAGLWELRTSIEGTPSEDASALDGAPLDDNAAPSVEIP